MEAGTIDITSKPEWLWALEAVGGADVYYMPGYLVPLAQRGEGRPILFYVKDGNRIALHVSFIRKLGSLSFDTKDYADRVDLCSPYGYGGPLTSDDDPEFVKEFWQAWSEKANSLGAVSEFIRFHPLLKNYLPFSELIDAKLYTQTVYIDLTRDRIEEAFSRTCSRNIRTAYKKGLEFELLNPVEWMNDFYHLYTQTMKRKSASNYYFFDEDYFMRLFDDLSPRTWLARTHYRGKTGAFGLFLKHERFIHYHLGCSDHDLRSYCPTNLLLYESALLAQKRGKQFFHLGGGLQHNFGLYRFKKSFSNKTADFYLGEVIFDPEAYDQLIGLRAAATRRKPYDDYFPTYRSPL